MRRLATPLLACFIFSFSPSNLPAAQVASPAPPFELVTFGGEAYSKDSLKGRPTLLVSPTTLGKMRAFSSWGILFHRNSYEPLYLDSRNGFN